MKIRSILSIFIQVLLFTGFSFASNIISPKPVKIEGRIVDYKGLFKSGKLTYFDAITKIADNEVFEISKDGQFTVSFNLNYALFGSITIEAENNVYSNFFVKPSEEYTVTISNDKIVFEGETGKLNRELAAFYEALNAELGVKIKAADIQQNQKLQFAEYLTIQKQLETDKTTFLKAYNQKNKLSIAALRLIEDDIKYKTAQGWSNFRFEFNEYGKRAKDSLPANFYADLYNAYPIDSLQQCQTLACINYLGNIVEGLENKNFNTTNRLEFYKSTAVFSAKEMAIVRMVYTGTEDSTITQQEYDNFQTLESKLKLSKLTKRFFVDLLMTNASQLKPSLGRDLLISQSVAKNFIDKNLTPSAGEWDKIQKTISNKWVFDYLKSLSAPDVAVVAPKEMPKDEAAKIKMTTEQVKAKYIDKYLGKVVYIDFYSTWCGPCRGELPFAKSLHAEFDEKDVVFLNLCSQSKKEDWEAMVKQKGIQGENYLLSNEEYYLISKMYDVHSFPTYVLIDKKGNVVNMNAPRPSSKQVVIEEIKKLL